MSNIVTLPDRAKESRQRRDLAQYLRIIADAIEADDAETEPHALLLVLTGRTQHEVLAAGYADDGAGFSGATRCMVGMDAAWPTAGRNIRQRQHDRYGAPYERENVTLFEPARRKSPEPSP